MEAREFRVPALLTEENTDHFQINADQQFMHAVLDLIQDKLDGLVILM